MDLLSQTEVAAKFGVSPERVHGWVVRGFLPSVRIGGRPLIPAKSLAGFELPRRGRKKAKVVSKRRRNY